MAPVVSMAPRKAAARGAARGADGLVPAQARVGDCALQRQAGVAWQEGRRRPRPGLARCGRRRPRLDAVRESRECSGWRNGKARGSLEAADRTSPDPTPAPVLWAAGQIAWARSREDGCDLPLRAAKWKWPSTRLGLADSPSTPRGALLGYNCVQFLSGLGEGGGPISSCQDLEDRSLYWDKTALGGGLLFSWDS